MFDDLNNSQHYKECLLKAYKAGNTNFYKSIPENVPKDERFNCPALDDFLERYGYNLNDYCKIDIYLTTGYWIEWYHNMLDSCLLPENVHDPMQNNMCGWIVDEARLNFLQKITDYELLKSKNIPGFPKTFDTFRKHREKNSDKYQTWIAYTKEVDHGKD